MGFAGCLGPPPGGDVGRPPTPCAGLAVPGGTGIPKAFTFGVVGA